jgi:hypothetical protein
MFFRTFCTLALTVPLLGVLSGCDTRPKIVMPTEKAPPAPRPHTAGPGNAPGEPAAPDTDPNEKKADANKPPTDSKPPEDNK